METTIYIREGFSYKMDPMSELMSKSVSELMSESMSELEQERMERLFEYFRKYMEINSSSVAEK